MQRAEEAGGSGGGQVMSRAGFDVRDRDRVPVGVADDLHVAAVGVVLAGEPQVMTGVGVLHAAAVGADEGAVKHDMGPAGGLAGLEHLVQVWCLRASTSMPSCR